jgi:hypothetical protein
LPVESAVARLYPGADLADAYAIRLSPDSSRSIVALARCVLGNPAPWVRLLMGLRDTIMTLFGVKTARQLREGGSDRIDIFRIYSISEHEMIVGEDDRHLDFRASILIRPSETEAGDELVTTTVVHCHNLLGRFYIALIAPFHRMVVRSNLHRAALKGWPAK